MTNDKVTLATDQSLALYGQKHTTTERPSRIDVTQAMDEKLVIFQVRSTIYKYFKLYITQYKQKPNSGSGKLHNPNENLNGI